MNHPAHLQTPETLAYFERYLQAWRRDEFSPPLYKVGDGKEQPLRRSGERWGG